MKTTQTKVANILIKWGNNVENVTDMVSKHFDAAITNNPNGTTKDIANFIRTIY